MPACPSCGRPVAVARACCLYCGVPLPTGLAAQATQAVRESVASPPPRTLLVLDPVSGDRETLARATGLSAYQAGLIVQRRAPHLFRILDPEKAESELLRLREAGLAALGIPEREARTPPLVALSGERERGGLSLRTTEGPKSVRAGELLLVVQGPVLRERQSPSGRRKLLATTREEGWRVHLHRLSDPRPIEIDPSCFEPGFAVTGSTRLEIDAWLRELVPPVRHDDGFRFLVPALAPAEPEAPGRLSALGALRAPHAERAAASRNRSAGDRETEREQVVLDNVAQFRFYSGWRGAFERRLPRPSFEPCGDNGAPTGAR